LGRRLWFSMPVESALGRAWFLDLYQIWYKSELDARGSWSPAAKSMYKIASLSCDYVIDVVDRP